jgi:signal transduction histidine kinase
MESAGSEPSAGARPSAVDAEPAAGASAEGLAPQAVLSAALEQMSDGLVVADAAGRLLVTNRAARELVGRQASGVGPADANLAEWWSRFGVRDAAGKAVPPEQLPLARALLGQESHDVALSIRRPGAEDADVVSSAVPVRDHKGRIVGAVAVFRDVTAEKRLAGQLAQQRRRSDEAAAHKLRMLTALARDVRNPLNSVVILSHLLRRNMHHRLTSDAIQCLEGMEEGIKRTLNLVNDLLNLSRLEAGIQQVEIGVFPLPPLIEECVEAVRGEADEKSLFLIPQLEPLEGAVIRSDRNKLRQVVGCLLANAVQFTEDGGIFVRARKEAGRLLVDVQDTGRGVAAEDRERIFDEYSRVGRNVDRDGARGTGLSLAVARRSARLLGGDLVCESTLGRGSVFTLILPEGGLPESTVAAGGADRPAETPSTPAAQSAAAEEFDEGES